MIKLILIVACFICSSQTFSQIRDYKTNYHFHFSVLSPFEPLSQERVQLIASGRQTISGPSKEKLLWVYSINDNDYPNIQVLFRPDLSFQKASFTEIAKTYKKVLADPAIVRSGEKLLAPIMDLVIAKNGEPVVNINKHSIIYAMKANTKGYGTLIKITGIFILTNGEANISFVCRENEIEKYSAHIYQLYNSVIIDNNYQHKY